MPKAVFLDRDGVLNHPKIVNGKPYPPANLEELVIYDEVLPALLQLKQWGFYLFVVTNQPDAARGKTTTTAIDALNDYIQANLPIDKVYACLHDDSDNCHCRKPKAGMLLTAVKEYDLAIEECFMVGDRWRDIQAGHNAGCQTVWINRQYDEAFTSLPPHASVNNLQEVVHWIGQKISCEESVK